MNANRRSNRLSTRRVAAVYPSALHGQRRDARAVENGLRVSADVHVITITLPIKTVSVLNIREHWAKRAQRAKSHRRAAMAVPAVPVPCTVRLIRIGPRSLDGDNLQGALKATRDGIADRLGVDDADPRVRWEYGQERSQRGVFAVRVELRTRGGGDE